MLLICREITDEAEREGLFRLRYAIYVEEMARPQSHADHRRRRLAEPLDDGAIHVGAFEATTGRLVGGLRMLFSDRVDLGSGIGTLYGLDDGRSEERVAIVTRLVTAPEARGGETSAGLHLAQAAYRIALRSRAAAAVMDCSAQLVPFFEWLGFDPVRSFEHADFGEVAIMRIQLHDRARLAKTDSPLAALLDAWRGGPPPESSGAESAET